LKGADGSRLKYCIPFINGQQMHIIKLYFFSKIIVNVGAPDDNFPFLSFQINKYYEYYEKVYFS
jgi:hypothetical protein